MEASEADQLAAIKKDILEGKREFRRAIAGITKLIGDYNGEGNVEAEAAAMDMRGGLLIALGTADQAHSRAMRALCDCFDDGGVVIQGGGGR
jgi:hypothetical protein